MKVVPRKRSCVLWDGVLVFISAEGRNMNFSAEMMPGITLLAAGAFLGFFADGVCKNKKNVQPMRLLGTFLAFAGAILVFVS